MRFLSMVRSKEGAAGCQPTPQLMQDMGKLIEEMTRKGVLIATGGLLPSSQGKRLRLRHGNLSVTDGPFTEAKEVIGGYAILEAATMEEAVELTKRFLRVHGDEWDVECELRPLAGPESGVRA
jgi:hypothetical protein